MEYEYVVGEISNLKSAGDLKIISYKLKANNKKIVSGKTDSLLANIDVNQPTSSEDYLKFDPIHQIVCHFRPMKAYLTVDLDPI